MQCCHWHWPFGTLSPNYQVKCIANISALTVQHSILSSFSSRTFDISDFFPQLQAEVAGLYEKYRLEVDTRKVLLSDYNDLKFRQQEQKGDEGGGGASEEREDPVVLKLKLT